MPTNAQQSTDVLHPLAFLFISHCNDLNVSLNIREINAIDFLVRRLTQEKLWDKFKAIYPFVGRSSVTHSLNLKNIHRHKIIWYNTQNLQHDSNGVTNKSTGYGNTLIAPSWFNDNNIHISIYYSDLWQNINSTAPIIGTRPQNNNDWMHTITLRSLEPTLKPFTNTFDRPPIFTYSCGYSSSTSVRFAGTDASEFAHIETSGFIVGVNGIKCYVNGTLYGRQGQLIDKPSVEINKVTTRTVLGTTAQIPNISQFPFLLFTNGQFSSTTGQARANIRFATAGYEINDYENKIFYEIVQEFQKILGREVKPVKLKTFEETLLEKYLTTNVAINKFTTLNTKPYREYLSITKQPAQPAKINTLSPNLQISKIEVLGPIRIFVEDEASLSVSIQSFVEI